MRHHTYTNDPIKDPDYPVNAPNWRAAIWKSVQRSQPGVPNSYSEVIAENADDPLAVRAGTEAVIQTLAYWGILAGLSVSGYAVEAILLWWLPKNLYFSSSQLVAAPPLCRTRSLPQHALLYLPLWQDRLPWYGTSHHPSPAPRHAPEQKRSRF
jgi:hypothetical protein